MAETRIDELRRRLEREPGSRLFAQLAEEHRKAGDHAEAIKVARAGLVQHPSYPSARLTLGRALLDSGDAVGARTELAEALREAPDNILASRFLGQALEMAGDAAGALQQYSTTLKMAPGDRQLEALIAALRTRLAAAPEAAAPPRRAPVPPPLPPTRPPAGPSTASAVPASPPRAVAPPVPRASVPAPPPTNPMPPSLLGAWPESAPPVSPGVDRPLAPAEGMEPTLRVAPESRAGIAEDTLGGTTLPRAGSPPAPAFVDTLRPAPAGPSSPPAPEATGEETLQPRPAPPVSPEPSAPAFAPGPAPDPTPGPQIATSPTTAAAAAEAPLSSSTLAELYLRQGLTERAREVYRRVLADDPANERARSGLRDLEAAPAPAGPGDDRAARRAALQRTIAALEALLAAVRRD